MREGTRRPGARADREGPQSASDADSAGGGGGAGDAQAAARQQRAHKRRQAAADADADAFNQRHATEAAEFNQLTKDACLGEDGKLDAAAVKEWQRDHNVAPDGKVGPKTLAAAGGKASSEPVADDAKVEQPKTEKANKKTGPIQDILQWLDLSTVRAALQQLQMLAVSPPAADKDKSGAKPEQADGDRDQSGIASQLAIDAFAAAVREQKDNWKGMRPAARGHKMLSFVNHQLASVGVPIVQGRLDGRANGNIAGKFHPPGWEIFLNPEMFSKQRLKDEDAPHMAATVYHEARHAEQHFRMAQVMAGQDERLTPAALAERLGIPPNIAAAAVQSKTAPTDPKASFGKQMAEDQAGAGAQHHAAAMKEIEAQLKVYEPLRQRYDAALASKDQDAIDTAHASLLKVQQPVMAAWDAYVRLATEVDAFQTERAVDKALGVAPQ
jgi:hypothetical protein